MKPKTIRFQWLYLNLFAFVLDLVRVLPDLQSLVVAV